jgi:quercetin dioxygenase-like cupin family protein
MHTLRNRIAIVATTLCTGLVVGQLAWSQGPAAGGQTKERARVVISQPLPKLNGDQLKATLVEVRDGPGEASPPHSHPCAVIGYVVEGEIRTQVKGDSERTYKAGETFYEPPHGVHLVSANASSTEPAKLVAIFVCDREAQLSIDVPANGTLKEPAK